MDKFGNELMTSSADYDSVDQSFKEGLAIVKQRIFRSEDDPYGVEFYGFIYDAPAI